MLAGKVHLKLLSRLKPFGRWPFGGAYRWLRQVSLPMKAGALGLFFVSAAQAQETPEKSVGSQDSPPLDPVSVSSKELAALEQRLAEQEQRLHAAEEREQQNRARIEQLEAEQASRIALEQEAEAAEQGLAAHEQELRFYGFADVALKKIYAKDGTRFEGIIPDSSTFVLGNLNLYMDAKPLEELRFLSEVRFTLYPNGSYPSGSLTRTDTTVFDTASATGRNQVPISGIVLERAHIEWGRSDSFHLLAGYFLTPYGIWNVDHGSPTLISSVLPGFWAGEYFPTRQLGVQALGDFFFSDWQLGYRAYISNGRTPGQLDLDTNKMLGGRAYLSREGELKMMLGASGFWAQNEDFALVIDAGPTFGFGLEKTVGYEEFGLGADLSLDLGAFRSRTEFVLHDRQYQDGFREAVSPVSFEPDQTRFDVYTILAYRTDILELEPFLYLEHDSRRSPGSNASQIYSLGLTEHLGPSAQLRFQGYYVHFLDDSTYPSASRDDFPGWDLRLVTAF